MEGGRLFNKDQRTPTGDQCIVSIVTHKASALTKMKKWELSLVPPTTSLSQAIETIDRSGLQIVVVVDAKRRILGTLTDGDVRRALIHKTSLDTAIDCIMTLNPRTALVNSGKHVIRKMMKTEGISQIPLINDEGEVVGIETLHDVLYEMKHDNIVFLMAGGFGKRLYPLTKECPKPLLSLGGRPILEIIIENFVRAGFHRFYISIHYMQDLIRETIGDGSRWNCQINYIHESEPMGTAGAIGMLPSSLVNLPMLIMNCDLLTNLDFNRLLDFHENHEATATVGVREYNSIVPYGVVEADGLKLKSMVEKPVYKYFVNAGIYVVSVDFVKSITQGERADMTNVIQKQVEIGKAVNVFPIHEYWLDIGRPEDLKRAQGDVASLFKID